MARDGAGVDVDLDRVPLREEDMEAWEIMVSESQERMVAVVRPERLEDVVGICRRWELAHAVIGEVTETGELRAFHGGEVVGEIPAALLTDECPRYAVETRPVETRPAPVADANLTSRRWIYERFDQLVGSRTVRRPGLDAAVLRLDGNRGLAVSLDGPPVGERDPFRAGALAVLDAARNVACVGGEPIGLTDCLNFGNPEKPEIGWELEQAIEGIAQAAEALGIPVVSGNVSLYNESPSGAIHPTPVIGMVGVLDDVELHVVSGFQHMNDVIVLLGSNTDELGGSEYLKVVHGLVAGDAPAVDLTAERALQEAVLEMADGRLLRSAHDCSEGGLAVCLAESAIQREELLGIDVQLDDDLEPAALLFGEAQGRIIVTCSPADRETVLAIASKHGVPARVIGKVTGGEQPRFVLGTGKASIDAAVADLAEVWRTAIPRLMERTHA
jgi:phosphoribosylformylglycinamidine synthase